MLTLIVTHCDSTAIIGESRRSADLQHGDTLSALGKTDATIAALNAQTETMREQVKTMRQSLRAFISIAGFQLVPYRKAGVEWTVWDIAPVLENSGNTPATRTSFRVNWCWRATPLPLDYGFNDLSDAGATRTASGPLFIPPRGRTAVGSATIPDFMLNAIAGTQQRAYVYGWVKFDDGLQRDPRVMKYCLIVNRFVGNPANGVGAIGYSNCPTHNCATNLECAEQAKKEVAPPKRDDCERAQVVKKTPTGYQWIPQ